MTQAAQSSRASIRERRKNLAMAATGVFMLLYAASLTADLMLDANLFWLTAMLILGVGVGAGLWAQALDEAKLNAHYVAWFWGGSAGLLASSLVFIATLPTLVTPYGLDAFVPAGLEPLAVNGAFAAGIALGMFPACIGYVIWWSVLSARRG